MTTTTCADCRGPLELGYGKPIRGDRFGFDGLLCARCYQRHRMRGRSASLLPIRLPNLPVLNRRVELDDVTPRLACRMILAETWRVFARRKTG